VGRGLSKIPEWYFITPPAQCSSYSSSDVGENRRGEVVALAIREQEESLDQAVRHSVEEFLLVPGGPVLAAAALSCLRVFSMLDLVLAGCEPAMR
jgi:hypothetical protein